MSKITYTVVVDDDTITVHSVRWLQRIIDKIDDMGLHDLTYTIVVTGSPIEYTTSIQDEHGLTLVSAALADGRTINFNSAPYGDEVGPATDWELYVADPTVGEYEPLGMVRLGGDGTYTAYSVDDGKADIERRQISIDGITSLTDAATILYDASLGHSDR
jgi:hypothetical protein